LRNDITVVENRSSFTVRRNSLKNDNDFSFNLRGSSVYCGLHNLRIEIDTKTRV